MDDEVLEINGKQYVFDPNHDAQVTIKKSAAEKYSDWDWQEAEDNPEEVEASLPDIVPWKDGEEGDDMSTYEADFCTCHWLDQEDVVDIS